MDALTDPHVLRHPAGLTVGEIAALTGAELQDVANRPQRMTNVAPIDLAEAGDLTFVDNAKFAQALTSTRAGAVLISEHFRPPDGFLCYPSGPVVDGVDGPLRHQLCQNEVVANLRQGSRP
jgi:hypothetical protein